MRLPNFMILGQGKAGTSLIWRVLRRHPDIAFPDQKELAFFSKHSNVMRARYDQHFENLPQNARYIGEVSPSYLHPESVQRIADTCSRDIKVAFVLRRPIEQAYSRYLQNICATPDAKGFEQQEADMRGGLRRIFAAIRLCHNLFGRENVLPLVYEHDIASGAFEAKILSHLGLPAANNAAAFLAGPPVNSGVMPRYIHAGDAPVRITKGDKTYEIPQDTLVFCAQTRNSTVSVRPDVATVKAAFAAQSAWTSSIDVGRYADLQTRVVLPMARSLQRKLGLDTDHWNNPPYALCYDPAPPPDRFLV